MGDGNQRPATAGEVVGLTRKFGDFTAVDGISFRLRRGEIFGFLGPNGSGKTTTIRMMLGLLPPTSGSVSILGIDVSRHATQIRRRVGYMSQRFSLYNDLTVEENLHFYGRAYGLRGGQLAERVRFALQMSGLAGREHALTRALAGGWRQRLALSAAILHRPEVLFLDEPTAGVDPVSRRAFWDLLYDLVCQGVTAFVTTHYMDEAAHCHRLAFIQRGRLIATGSPATIKQDMMPGEVLEVAVADPLRALAVLQAAQAEDRLPLADVELYGTRLHAIAPDAAALQPLLVQELERAGLETTELTRIEPTLEDVFIACMR